jgi:hypothetical protein
VRLAAILGRAHALDQAALLQAIHELDRAVMTKHEALRQVTHRRGLRSRRSECQQQLVLLRLQPSLLGPLLGERQEATQLMTKLGQRAIISVRQTGSRHVDFIS